MQCLGWHMHAEFILLGAMDSQPIERGIMIAKVGLPHFQ